MKILIIGLNYKPEPVGIGPYTGGLAESLAAAGHSVEALVSEQYYPEWARVAAPALLWQTTVEQRVRVTRCRTFIPRTPTGPGRVAHALSFAMCALPRALWSALRGSPDVVLAVTPSLFSVCIAWIAARLCGAKLWTHVQDFEADAACATGLIAPNGATGRLAKWFEATVLCRSDKVSTISPQMQSRLLGMGIPTSRTYELRNWAAHEFAPDEREAAHYRTQWDVGARKVVLYSGSIANKQGIEVIVDAARLLKNREDILFVICGSGPNRARLEVLAQGLGNIQIHSLQPAARMGGLLALAQVHVLPQIAEAADLVLPSKLCNMLSSGRPVVATASRGTGLATEVAGCGLVTPPGDAAALAAGLATLVDDASLADKLGRAGIARARERWGQGEILAAFEAELLRIVRPHEPVKEPRKQTELPEQMIRRVLLGIAAMFYSRVSTSAAQLFLVPTLALCWGLPRYGQWLMLSTIPTFLAASDLGFGITATMRLIAEVARGDIDEARLTYRAARTIVMILSAIVLALAAPIVLALPASWLAVHNGMGAGEARLVLGLLCLYGPLTLQGQLFMAVARATGRIAQAIMIETTIGLAEALAVGATALAQGSPVVAAAALLAVRTLGVAAMYALSRRAAPWRRGPSQRVGHRLRQMWRPAMAATLIPVSQALYLQGSAIAVGFAGGAAIVPIVTSLRTLSRIALQATAIVAVPLMPEFAAMYVRADRQRASLIVSGLTAISIVAGGSYALLLGLAGKPLIALWTGGSVAPPQAMITLTAIGLAASVLWNPLSDLLLSINRHESFSVAYSLCAVLTVALTVPLVHALGVTGAAAANLLLEGVMAFVVVRALVAVTGRIQMRMDTLAHVLPPRWRSALRLR